MHYFSQKYRLIAAQNFLITNTSSVFWTKHTYLDYRIHSIGIENYLPIQAQFLYLLLVSKTFPFLARKYPSRKKYYFGDMRSETAKIAAYPNQHSISTILHKFMYILMKDQISPEPPTLKIEDKFTKIIIWNVPLDLVTNCLVTSNTAYIDDIPLYIKFLTKQSLRRELAFWTFFHHFLRIKDAFIMWELGMKKYKYLDNIN